MQLFVFVLNRTEYLERLLEEFCENGLTGATVLESTGMARILLNSDADVPFFAGLRALLNPERRQSKTIFMVLKDEHVDKAKNIVNKVTGGLDSPDTGIMFALPLTMVEGLDKRK